ncbi:MAG: MFS transporter [Rhizobiaceae bacterium]
MQNQQHHCPPERRKFVLIVAILASAMGFIDFSIIAVALPQIREVLGADFAEAQWISNAYMLFLSALILLGGALGDRFGLKYVFAIGIGLFTLASLACAIAWNVESLIVFRAIQGMGAAVMIPGSMALISINTPRTERGKALGIWVSASAITTSLGPLLGSLLLTYGDEQAWRWIFAINLPFGIVALAILWRLVPADKPVHSGGLASIDWAGAFLLTAALAMMAGGLTFLSELDGGQSAVALLLAGLVVASIAVFWELRHRDPMVNLRLFGNSAFAGGNALTFLVWACVGANTFFLPMLLIVAWKLPPTYAAGVFLPFSVMIALLSPFSGRMADRFGARLFLTIGSVVVGLSLLALGWAVAKQAYWLGIIPATTLTGIGMGLTASPISTAIMNAVESNESGVASGINNMVARMSGMFGVAGLGAIIAYIYNAVVLGGELHPDIAQLMVKAGFGERLTGPLYQISTETLQAVAMNHAMIGLCVVMSVMCLVAAVIGWFSQPKQ